MTARRGLVAAALALALLPLAPAHAAGSAFLGDCGWDTVAQEHVTGGQDVFTGAVFAAVVLYGPEHHNVVNATVTCELRVNDAVQASSSRWGSGVVVLADTLTFVARDVDEVTFCTSVDFTSDDTPTTTQCRGPTKTQFPPQEWIDLLDVIFEWLAGGLVTYVDPVVCAVIAGHEDVYDCPPYGDPAPEPWAPGVPPLPGTGPNGASGGGYNTGDAGFLLLTDAETRDVASTCAYATDRATGTITVSGATVTDRAASATVRCRLADTATGTVLYDGTVPADAPAAVLRDTIPANAGPVTVCTSGTGTWTDRTVTVGPHCRPGEPLGGSA